MVLYKTFNKWSYTDPITTFNNESDIYYPVVIDTEYTDGHKRSQGQLNITVQCKGVNESKGMIFIHPDMILKKDIDPRLSKVTIRHDTYSNFVVIDYLKKQGYNASIKAINRSHDHKAWFKEMPKIWIDIYGMFLVVDFLRVVTGVYQNELIDLTRGIYYRRGITMERRLRGYTKIGVQTYDWVLLPWIVTINGQEYQVKLRYYDIAGLHGTASLDDIAHNVGVETVKSLISQSDKNKMLEVYQNRPDVFDEYALGDLIPYDIMMAYNKKLKQVYQLLDLKSHFDDNKSMKLTIGSCTNKLIMSSLLSTGIDEKTFKELSKNSNANQLKRDKTTTKAYLLKVDGGRCYNNRPLDIVAESENNLFRLVDIDIKGAYSTSQESLAYPIGNPMILDYQLEGSVSSNAKYLTLRQFLKKYRQFLVDGCWYGRVSLKNGYTLKYNQDIFLSWYPSKTNIHNTEGEEIDNNNTNGNFDNSWSKVFSNEIHLAAINSDLLEWIENIASEKQRKELLDNLFVIVCAIYPKDKEVNSVEELLEKYKEHEGNNTTKLDVKNSRKEILIEDFHYWYKHDYGKQYIKKLKNERAKYPKKDPLNTLFKLFGNTSYGDIVSPWFDCGNVILGNNITARVRVVMWCIEKAFYGYQSITDGCVINLDEIPFINNKRYKLNGINTVASYRKKQKERNWSLGTIENYDWESCGLIETLQAILKHHFGELSCLKYFEIEIKRIAQKAIFHGSGNYRLEKVVEMESINNRNEKLEKYFPKEETINIKDENGTIDMESEGTYIPVYKWIFDKNVNKMRSYSRRGLIEFDWENYDKETFNREDLYITEELEINEINYAEIFLKELGQKSNELNRRKPVMSRKILKPKEFKNRYETMKHLIHIPGVSLEGIRLPLEISLNQFLYQTSKQYNTTIADSTNLKTLWSQGFEMYFLNEDGTLRYLDAINKIDEWIQTGRLSLRKHLENELEGHSKDKKVYHPMKDEKDRLQLELEEDYLNE